MKLVLLFEDNLHPDLIPAMEALSKKTITQIREAGIGIIPATENLGAPDRIPNADGSYSFNQSHRWHYSSYGALPRWLLGYVKMGMIYLAVYMAMDGSITTRAQHKSARDAGSDNFNAEIWENHDRSFKDVDAFIKYATTSLKDFVQKQPVDRFFGFIEPKHLKYGYYRPPEKVVDHGGLDDADDFQGGKMVDGWGVSDLVEKLVKLGKAGNQIDPNGIVIRIESTQLRRWLERSGYDVEPGLQGYSGYATISPKDAFATEYNGDITGELTIPNELKSMLMRRAAATSKRIMAAVQKELNKPSKGDLIQTQPEE